MNEKKDGNKNLNKKLNNNKEIETDEVVKKNQKNSNFASLKSTDPVSLGKNKISVKKNVKSAPPVKQYKKNKSAGLNKVHGVKIVHLGGLDEIGKNMICFEYGNDMIIVDCGMGFPSVEMLGVDIVLPDYSYIEKNKEKLKAVVITHGHEDHIGGIPFFLKRFNVPIYGTRLTIGLIEEKLKEHKIPKGEKLHVCSAKSVIKLGAFTVEMINVNHSIPDAVGLAISTPAGVILHTGDFKIDYNPISGSVIDLARFAEFGSKGVLLLMADSTNAERPGHTMPERQVGESFKKLFSQAFNKRIIIASFSSNIHRIQQIIDNAVKYKRYVIISGRSMENIVAKAIELSYLTVPDGVIISMDKIAKYPKEKLIIVTTGSQGEPMSALSRMANGMHKNISVTSEDYIIISATPIPGNEKLVTKVVNDLMKLGATVIYEKLYEIHTSGHACQDELKTMLVLTKPKYYMPIHGEYKHLKANAKVAASVGISEKNILIKDIGNVVEIGPRGVIAKENVPVGCVFVDGLGVGDVGSVVLRDRKILSQFGVIIITFVVDQFSKQVVSGPNLITRGFVYVKESEQLLFDIKNLVRKIFDKHFAKNIADFSAFKSKIRDELSNFIFKKTRRNPMILPIVMEV